MTIKIGINGFGRIGRLVLRAAFDWPEVSFVRINDVAGSAATLAHLLNYDSVHGKWQHEANATDGEITVGQHRIRCSQNAAINDTDWSDCDLVIEASGVMRQKSLLEAYTKQGVKRVVVTAPVKEEGILNAVMGVNHTLFNPAEHAIVTAASCTTNCLAPVVKVIHEKLGIVHGSMTTIHADSPAHAVSQLALLVLQSGARLSWQDIVRYVRSTVDVFVQLRRRDGMRQPGTQRREQGGQRHQRNEGKQVDVAQ